jgi:hypothetical protein
VKAFVVWWLVGFFVFTVWTGDGLVGALGGLATWFLTVQVWWRTPCRRCGGSPKVSDWASVEKWRPCSGCAGRGWVPRLFAVGRE